MSILTFGEILYDVYNDEKKIGGAPLNVSSHLVKLGSEVVFISAIGNDELGHESERELDRLLIERRYVKCIDGFETGKAFVKLKDGIPSYSFTTPAAWDEIYLSEEELRTLKETNFDAFYYGTLASRSERSRKTLSLLFKSIKARLFFFDVNLRLSYYSKDIIETGLEKANILKLNDEEEKTILSLFSLDSLETLMKRYSIDLIILTEGKKGTTALTEGKKIHQPANKVKVVDTTGAGDSISAGIMHFLSKGKNIEEALEKASLLADFVVTQKGACPDYPEKLIEMLSIS